MCRWAGVGGLRGRGCGDGSAQEAYAATFQLADCLARSLALAWLLLPHIAPILVITYAQTLAWPCLPAGPRHAHH